MIRAARTLVSLGIALVPLASAAAILGWLRAPRGPIDFCYSSFCRVGVWGTGARLLPPVWRTSRDRLPPSLVVVSNHESHLDVPAILLALAPRSLRFVAKKELFKIPFLGWGMRATGNIMVERNRSASDLTRLRDAAEHTQVGDVLFFAEGTRTLDGSMREFKKGAFVYAIEAQRPILPVGVAGGYEILPPRTLDPRPGPVAVVIGEPVETRGLDLAERDALRDRVRNRVAELREEALRLVGSPRMRAS